jgi:autotransporter-associated beta strand protein
MLLSLIFAPVANAALKTWNGGGLNGLWSNAANWNGTGLLPGDDLLFTGSTRLINTNDIVTFSLNSIQYTASGFSTTFLTNGPGYFVTITNGIIDNSGFNTNNLTLILAGNQGFTNMLGGTFTVLGGAINMTSNSLTLGGGGGQINLNGIVSGTTNNALTIYDGITRLAAANTFTGPVTVNSGTLQLGNAAAIPSGAGKGNLTINSPGSMDLGNVSPTINGLNGSGTIDESPTTNAGNYTITLGTGNSNGIYSGIINNSHGVVSLIKNGTGSQVLSGFNAYAGATTVSGGVLAVTNNGVIASTNISVAAGATLIIDSPSSIPSPANITIAPTGLFDSSRANPLGGYVVQGNFSAGRSTNFTTDVAGNLTVASANLTMVPGAAATMTINGDVTMFSTTLNYDLNTVTTPGAGSNDLINLTGTLNVSPGVTTVKIKPINGTVAGTYTLITSGHAINGNPGNFQLAGPRGITAVFDTTTQPNNVLVTAAGSPNPAHVTWAGNGAGGPWDVQITQSWLSNGVPDFYYDLDFATFNDAAGAANGTVSFPNAVSPSSLVVSNSAFTYTFGALNGNGGGISGNGSLTKDGGGTLVLNLADNYTGDTVVNRGTIVLGTPVTGGSANIPAVYNGVPPQTLWLGNAGLYEASQADTFITATFSNLVVKPGGSSLSQRPRTSNSTTYYYAISNIVRQVGGTLDFNDIQGKAGSAIGVYLTNATPIVNGIQGGYAVWGESDWVNPISTGNGSVAYAGYQANATSSAWGTTSNVNVTATPTAIAASQTINSLRVPAAATVTINPGVALTLSSGGLLHPANATGAPIITGGTLLGAAGADLIIHANNLANTLTIGSVVADNGSATALTKAGPGTLILSGNDTYSGVTYINGPTIQGAGGGNLPAAPIAAGTLQIGSGGTSGGISNSPSVQNMGTLAFNRSDAMTYGGLVSGFGGIKQAGSGTTILTADNTYFGITTITAGTLQIGNGGATGSFANSANVANAGTLAFNRSGTLTYGGIISGIGSVNVLSGTVVLNTNETYTGSSIVTAGTLALGATGSISSSSQINIAGGATLDATAPGGITLGTQTLLGTGTVLGNLTTAAGSAIKAGRDGTTGTINLNGNVSLAGGTITIDVNGAARDLVNIQGNLNITSPTVISINNLDGSLPNGTYKLIGFTGSLSGNLADLTVQFPFQPGQLASLSSTANEIDLVIVSGSGANLTWIGDGGANLWNVASALTFTNDSGTPTLFHNNDTANFTDAGSANNGVNIAGALTALVSVNASGDYTFQGNGSIAGGILNKSGTGNLNILTTNAYSGATAISNGTVTLGNGAINGTLGSGAVNNQSALIFNEAGDVTESGAISGPGSITLSGPAKVTLTGNNSGYTGGLTINTGTLQVGAGSSSGTLGSGPVTNNAAIIINHSDSGLVINSPITGTGSVTNSGVGVITVTGPNTYNGFTVIANGTLKAGSTAAIPSGVGDTNVVLDGSATTAGTLDLNGFNLNINGLDGASGTVLSQVLNNSGSSNLLTLGNGDANGTFNGTIKDGTGKLALIKVGIGTETLSIPTAIANTYSGGTVISNGTLTLTSPGGSSPANLNASQAALGSGPVTFYGGSLALAGSIPQSTGPTWNNWSGTVIVPAGQSGTIHGVQRGQASPIIQGAGTLLFQTAYVRGQLGGDGSAFTGTLILAGDSNGGNLGFESSIGFPNARVVLSNGVNVYCQLANTPTIAFGELSADNTVVVQLSGAEAGNGANPTAANFMIGGLNTSTNFTGNIIDNVGIIKVGTGKLSLDGATISYTGLTTVSNGVLTFTAAFPNNSTSFNLAAPGILDLGSFSPLNVNDGQSIQGNGYLAGGLNTGGAGAINPGFTNQIGTLTVSNDVTMTGVINLELNRTNATGGTNDQLVAANITVGGTLNVTNLGPTLVVGDTFKLFKTAGTLSGAWTTVNIATNDATGYSYTWQDNSAVDGTIKVLTVTAPSSVILPTVPPAITGFSLLSATNVVINGTNAQTGATYYLLTSTNVASPASLWKTIATNVAAANNAYSFTNTNAVNPSASLQFYMLSSTNFNP